MVAIRHREADALLAKPIDHLGYFLFHGSDSGVIAERIDVVIAASIEDPNDPFQLVRLDGDELSRDPGRLADEVNSIGLFGGRRAILIRAGSRNFTAALEAIIGSKPVDVVVIVEAGALKKDAALRKLFDRERHAVSIECSNDDAGQIRKLIESTAGRAGVVVEPDAINLLSRSLGNDRLTTRLELDKLLLYAHGQDAISRDDVEASLADAATLNLDAAVQAAFSGHFADVDALVHQALSSGADAGTLLMLTLRHATMLHRAHAETRAGMARDAAIERAQRRTFSFARRDVVVAQFNLWTLERLVRAIEILAQAIGDCRRDIRLAEQVATRTFWTIANAARRSGRN